MKEKILSILEIIEKIHNVKIIYACESGSRAWGFHSKDSDWDIRFIYKRPLEDYLTIFPDNELTLDRNHSKAIKDFVKHDLDFVGHDIKKTLHLISKGNPDIISWLHSPIRYICTEEGSKLAKLSSQFFQTTASFYHYMHMASGNYRQYLAGVPDDFHRNSFRKSARQQVVRKKYLYVLRPIINCMWLELFKSAPPMIFEEAYQNEHIRKQLLDGGVYHEIKELVRAKKSGEEMGLTKNIASIDMFCVKKIEYFSNTARGNIYSEEKNYDELDYLFKQIVKGDING